MTTEEVSDEPLNAIWADDLLGRRIEAQMIADYIGSAFHRNSQHQSYLSALAIDAGYGQGKTFFLRHLAEHLGVDHPVAFIDAWADDIADDPLTALAATLSEALEPLLPQDKELRVRWKSVREKTGKIAVIAAKGLAKRGLGLLITGAAVEGIDSVVSGVSEATEEVITDAVKDTAQTASNSIADKSAFADPAKIMDKQIEQFRVGRQTIEDLRASLSAMVDRVSATGKSPPIIIIIDELDRCRPAYAVKLLEEIKHLFGVPGIYFVFGIFGDQLASAMNGAYGPNFDGRAYLRRFIGRSYRLRSPSLEPLVSSLFAASQIPMVRLRFPNVKEERRVRGVPATTLIARYFRIWDVSARDVYAIVDSIQTCLALTKEASLEMALLLPLLISKVKGKQPGEIAAPVLSDPLEYAYYSSDGKLQSENFMAVANTAPQLRSWNQQSVLNAYNQGSLYGDLIMEHIGNNQHVHNELSDPRRYLDLVEAMGRFTVVAEAAGSASGTGA